MSTRDYCSALPKAIMDFIPTISRPYFALSVFSAIAIAIAYLLFVNLFKTKTPQLRFPEAQVEPHNATAALVQSMRKVSNITRCEQQLGANWRYVSGRTSPS